MGILIYLCLKDEEGGGDGVVFIGDGVSDDVGSMDWGKGSVGC